MKTLELKHLSAYLPYEVTARIEDYQRDYVGREFDKIIGIHQWDKSGQLWCVITEGGAKPSLDRIKLQLRPLSQLSKEIEHNGDRFVPIEKIKEMYPSDTFSSTSNAAQWSYRIVEKLLSWHFDLFGLLENNLAIEKS